VTSFILCVKGSSCDFDAFLHRELPCLCLLWSVQLVPQLLLVFPSAVGAGSAAFFRLHCKARSSLRLQGSSCSRRPFSPLTVSSSHLHADPVLIGENREFLAAIDSRFNISEVVLQLSPLSGSSGHCPCSGSWSGWRGLTRWSSPCPHTLWLLVSSLKLGVKTSVFAPDLGPPVRIHPAAALQLPDMILSRAG